MFPHQDVPKVGDKCAALSEFLGRRFASVRRPDSLIDENLEEVWVTCCIVSATSCIMRCGFACTAALLQPPPKAAPSAPNPSSWVIQTTARRDGCR